MVYLDFVKMHGLFNSFILISDFSKLFLNRSEALAKAMCSSQAGVGADGLVLLRPGDNCVDFIMDFYNADGSRAEMCGNAVRCLAKYVDDENLLPAKGKKQSHPSVSFLTPVGIITTHLIENREGDAVVSVDMGKPIFNSRKSFVSSPAYEPGGFEYHGLNFVSVSMGNPHAVTFLPPNYDWSFDYATVGAALQKEDIFPEGVNVEFARVVDQDVIEVRVIERGVGETQACGTGACAVAAAHLRNHANYPLRIRLLGGELTIRWRGGESSMEMIGPVKKIAAGRYFFEEEV